MQLYSLDPLSDPRWHDFVSTHPRSSIFHQKGWLRTLATTYGYHPIVLTSALPGKQLRDGIVFCEVTSWITGKRLVSLPFSDHADLLVNDTNVLNELENWIGAASSEHAWKYIEIRPLSTAWHAGQSMFQSQSFLLHTLDLTIPSDRLFRNLHKSCVQRRIRHAEQQKLIYERSSSGKLVDEFYNLHIMTRRRQRTLSQPRAWFRNLMTCVGANAEIRLIRSNRDAIAAILTLRHRGTVVYKYGCSDERFHHLAAMPYLFWKMIEESKAENAEQIDLGRTDIGNDGLARFKDHLGGRRHQLNYFRSAESKRKPALSTQDFSTIRTLLSVLPTKLSTLAGDIVYRHIG